MVVLENVLQHSVDGLPHVNRVVVQGTLGLLTIPSTADGLLASVLSPMALGAAYGAQVHGGGVLVAVVSTHTRHASPSCYT